MSYTQIKAEDKILAWAQETKREFDLDDAYEAFSYNSRNYVVDMIRLFTKQGKLASNDAPRVKERKWRVA